MAYESLEDALQEMHAKGNSSQEATRAFLAGAVATMSLLARAGEGREADMASVLVERLAELMQEAGELGAVVLTDAEARRTAAMTAGIMVAALKALKRGRDDESRGDES